MTNGEIFSHIDHTMLRPTTTWQDIKILCDEAVAYATASVCIPPCYVSRARSEYPQLNICTVIGFPLGYNSTAVKIFEARCALEDGADEIDMVVNISEVKNGNFDLVHNEISALKKVAGDKILKVIIEACYLTEYEKEALCKCISEAKADYIKTSTGFGTGGAVLEDIRLFQQCISSDVKIKAAGGVRTREDMVLFIKEGCSRIGASGAVATINGSESPNEY